MKGLDKYGYCYNNSHYDKLFCWDFVPYCIYCILYWNYPRFAFGYQVGILYGNFFAFIASLVIEWVAPVDYTGKNEYLVRIDDTVSFNEVIDKYEIVEIDEENGTVTLKDKVQNENKP